MDQDSSPTELVRRYREGDPEAARALFKRYAQSLGGLTAQHLSRKLAGRVEAEDVVQSVFRTFFHRLTRGEFQIDARTQLWQLLVKITVLKARAQGRRHTAAVRDVAIEEPGGAEDWLSAVADREPGPEEAALLVDQIEALVRDLPDLYVQVLQLRLEGHSVAEIAIRFKVTRQVIYRALGVLQHRLTGEQ